jgi:hypothetical protein
VKWDLFNPSGRPFSPSDRFLNDLVWSRGEDDRVLDRRVHEVLREVRFRKAIEPWRLLITSVFKVIWSQIYGLYRRARPQVHIYTTIQSGGLSGTVSGAGPFLSGAGPVSFGNPVGIANAPTFGPGETFEDAGIRAGEVVAYRCWVLHGDGLLHSNALSDFVWQPGKVAEGDPSDPFRGIHAFKQRWNACQYVGWNEVDGTIMVSGTVELWGEVYEHTRGYRASRARIKSIDDSPHYDADALRKLYKLNRRTKKKPNG